MKICSIDDMIHFYEVGEFKKIAINLPHLRDEDHPLVKFLMESNLLRMKEWVDAEKELTIGADPEFILADKKTDKVVLFSSQIATNVFNLSEAAVGADYGLMELRTRIHTKAEDVISNIKEHLEAFKETYKDLKILKKEAVEFNHARQRIRETMLDEKVDHGVNFHHKIDEVWSGGDASIESLEIMGTTLSAYDKPIFGPPNPELFTAGGHIHVGGAYVKMLSFPQLKKLIRKIDQEVAPKCASVETEAAELRKQAYGFPGEFRIKAYGFEYRSPSNAIFWEENHKILKDVLETIIGITKKFALEEIA